MSAQHTVFLAPQRFEEFPKTRLTRMRERAIGSGRSIFRMRFERRCGGSLWLKVRTLRCVVFVAEQRRRDPQAFHFLTDTNQVCFLLIENFVSIPHRVAPVPCVSSVAYHSKE